MKIFVLDDMSVRIECFQRWYEKDTLIIATTAQEAIDILTTDLDFDALFLDHDLGDRIFVDIKDENTGSRVAEFLSDKIIRGKIIIHSWNPMGAKNMMHYLPAAVYIPISNKESFDNILGER